MESMPIRERRGRDPIAPHSPVFSDTHPVEGRSERGFRPSQGFAGDNLEIRGNGPARRKRRGYLSYNVGRFFRFTEKDAKTSVPVPFDFDW